MRKRMILIPTLAIVLLLIIEQLLEIPYFWKTIMKIFIFLAVPIFLMKMLKFRFLRPNKTAIKSTKLAFVLGILVMITVLSSFFILVDMYKDSRLKWVLPSFLFAIYHIAIFLPWFDWPILLTAVAGLFFGGLIFQWMNEESGTIYPSWIIHICEDIGVLLIGFYMFYL